MKKIIIIVISILAILLIAGVVLYNVMFIGKDEVKRIVFDDANLTENDVKRWNAELGYEDGGWTYDVEYVYDNKEYKYEIDAKTGDIIIHGIDR